MDPTPALTSAQLRKARAAKLPAGHPERAESTRAYAVERAAALLTPLFADVPPLRSDEVARLVALIPHDCERTAVPA